jgi:hypothetical protein
MNHSLHLVQDSADSTYITVNQDKETVPSSAGFVSETNWTVRVLAIGPVVDTFVEDCNVTEVELLAESVTFID